MNEKFNKNAKFEKLTNMILGSGEEKGLIVKASYKDNSGPLSHFQLSILLIKRQLLANMVHVEFEAVYPTDVWTIYSTSEMYFMSCSISV